MPVKGSAQAATIAPLLREPTAGFVWRDAHLHIGHNDPDGTSATLQDILDGLDDAGHAGGLVYPMHEPGGYPAANDMLAAAVAASGGRLDWLCRVNPDAPGAVAEATRCLQDGAAGIKLHPRSDAFGLPHPTVGDLVALAATRRAPVLFHAGRGIPNLGAAAADLARAHPDARIILAHAGISDLGLLGEAAAALPNLLFDTSWWHVGDVLTLVTSVPPGQILYASDMPYGPGLSAAFLLARCLREVGLGDEALACVAGEQLARVVAGEDLLDLGPAPGSAVLGRRSAPLERVVGHTAAALPLAYHHGDCAEAVALARLGCQHGPGDEHAELLDVAAALLDRALELAGDEDRMAPVPLFLAAHTLCGTPRAGVPSV